MSAAQPTLSEILSFQIEILSFQIEILSFQIEILSFQIEILSFQIEILSFQIQLRDVPEVHKFRRSPVMKGLKLRKGRSGVVPSVLS